MHSVISHDLSAEKWIAVVDTRPSRREFISRFLAEQGCLNGRILPVAADELIQKNDQPSMIVFSVGGISLAEPTISADFGRLLDHFGKTPVVVLSDLDSCHEAKRALGAGAQGFVTTELEPSLMCAALALVQTGGRFAPPTLFDQWLDATSANHGKARHEADGVPLCGDLTQRQTHVLQLLKEGHANKVIAASLGMTESTVKVHVRQIMRRLGTKNRTEAALLAQRYAALRTAAD